MLDHLDALSAVGLRCLVKGLLVQPFDLIERPATCRRALPFPALPVVLFAVSIMLRQFCSLRPRHQCFLAMG
ncbi:hypothetical protein [Mesorhizobium sp. WSM3626]|uniref:hypothetical protein n=1 Tax=Mesorhizobium sp. WSM3626 TaxID=1040987 RepID=UPI0012EB70C1|nr:hypothetical protein [Mesorhizobium sp. WSM3626]